MTFERDLEGGTSPPDASNVSVIAAFPEPAGFGLNSGNDLEGLRDDRLRLETEQSAGLHD
jgi:hypothetical protein